MLAYSKNAKINIFQPKNPRRLSTGFFCENPQVIRIYLFMPHNPVYLKPRAINAGQPNQNCFLCFWALAVNVVINLAVFSADIFKNLHQFKDRLMGLDLNGAKIILLCFTQNFWGFFEKYFCIFQSSDMNCNWIWQFMTGWSAICFS